MVLLPINWGKGLARPRTAGTGSRGRGVEDSSGCFLIILLGSCGSLNRIAIDALYLYESHYYSVSQKYVPIKTIDSR